MMIATERAISGRSGSCCGRSGRRLRSRVRMRTWLHLEDFGFLAFQEVVDPVDVLVGELLHALLGPVLLVGGDLALGDELLHVVHDVAAYVPHRDAAVLGALADDLDEVLSPLLCQLGDREADDLAVVRGRQAEIGLHDRLLDRLQRAGVEGLDRQHPRLRHVDRGELVQRRGGPVVVHRDVVEQGGRRPAGADAVELVLRRLDGFVHAADVVLDDVVDHGVASWFSGRASPAVPAALPASWFSGRAAPAVPATLPAFGVEMIVPTRSPATMRLMLPSASSNTWIGRLLSMQSESAVVSITFNPRSIASRWVSCGRNSAFGSSLGSPS